MFLVVIFLDAGGVGRSGNAALSNCLRTLNMSLPLRGFEDSFPLKTFLDLISLRRTEAFCRWSGFENITTKYQVISV